MNIEIVTAAQKAASAYAVPVAWLAAVIEKESGGQVYAMVSGERRPLIRWEGHYFYQRLTGEVRAAAVAAGLAAPRAGAIKNPKDQVRRWTKLETPACAIDADAAHESTSWGVGQVMGAHWQRLGYSSAGDLVKAACSGLDGQVDLMMRYIKSFDLLDELQRGDALGFARGYNGPATPASYAADIARLAKDYGATAAPAADRAGMLRMGMSGADVRELQALLVRANCPVKVDGDFGPATKTALKRFQAILGLTVDGVAGPETMRALANYRVDPKEMPGQLAVMDTPEAKTGGAATVTGAAVLGSLDKVQPYIDQINQAADKLSGVSALSSIAGYATTALYVIAGALIVGGIAWAIVGWIKSRRTVGG